MNMQHRGLVTAIVTVAALSGTSAAFADPAGFYVGIYGGTALVDDMTLYSESVSMTQYEGATEPAASSITAPGLMPMFFDFALPLLRDDTSYAMGSSGYQRGDLSMGDAGLLGLVAGYRFGNGVRVEADLSVASLAYDRYELTDAHHQEIDGIRDADVLEWILVHETHGSGIHDGDMSGEAPGRAVFALVNAFYDFDTGTAFTPYAGLGAGVALVSHGLADAPVSAIVPAAQLGAGLRIDTGTAATLDLGYRLRMAAVDRLEDRVDSSTPGDGVVSDSTRAIGIDGPLVMHAFQAGVSFAFQ